MTKTEFYLKMITSSLLRRRSRMIVALLAIAIGSTVLSGLITIYYDVPRQMGQELRSYGANLLLLPSQTETISKEDFETAEKQLSSSSLIGMAPFRYESAKVNEQPFIIAGTDIAQVKNTSPYWYITGTWPEQPDTALIGQTVAQTINLFPGNQFTAVISDSEGKPVRKSFTVSGILQTGGNEEECIYIALSELEQLKGTNNEIDLVECSIQANTETLQNLSEKITSSTNTIEPRLVKRVTQSEGTVLAKLQSLVWIVTIIVLILTMVCVATTMMAVVAERRKEIGLKKALGASNKEIIIDFLGEGLFLGALGGVLGIILGFFFAQAVSINVFARSISFQPLIIPFTIIVSVAVTGLACLLPVKSTTEVDPAIVLKGE